MSENTLTHKELATILDVSETTIKSYRRKFPGCLPVASNGKPIRFKVEAQAIALRIRDLFATGMSVEEVAVRLAEEFSYELPSAKNNKKNTKIIGEQEENTDDKLKGGLPNSFATALSNMAKSMITLNRHQETILSKMSAIESMLSQLGLSGFNNEQIEELKKAKNKREAAFNEAMANIFTISSKLDVLLNNQGIENTSKTESSSRIVNIYQYQSDKTATQQSIEEPEAQAASVQEVPRHYLTLPLVIKTETGAYMNAGGNLGRLSINDLKAMLSQYYVAPNNFSLHWVNSENGWWFILDKHGEAAEILKVLVKEMTSSRGSNALVIMAYEYNGEMHLPIDFYTFISNIGN